MTLAALNHATGERALKALLACCGSRTWVERMLANRPLSDVAALHETAESVWFSLTPGDWLEAFSKHPKIGDKSYSKWSAQEQQGMSQASRDIADAMRELNAQYQRKFGFIFIVCASGKSAEEMRSMLEQRLSNDPDTELQIAAAEQVKIMHLRLDKMLAG